MFRSCILVQLSFAAALLVQPVHLVAQRHGGHGMGGSIPGGNGRPGGVDEKDPLQESKQILAMQGTSEQVAEFTALVQSANDAKDRLGPFLGNGSTGQNLAAFDQSLQSLRSGTRKFQEGLSEVQKSGLKKTTKRLEKADLVRNGRRTKS